MEFPVVFCKLTDVGDDFNSSSSASANMMKAIACIQDPETIKKICEYHKSRVAKINITESVNI